MEILVDSGATINIMAGSLAKDIGIKYKKSPKDDIIVLDAQNEALEEQGFRLRLMKL